MSGVTYPPVHVAIVMDGNGRWARKRGLPRLVGHGAGVNNIRPVSKAFAAHGVKYLTLYAFSTENWSRPRVEVAGLLRIMARRIDRLTRLFHEDNSRLVHVGKLDKLPQSLQQKVETSIELTRNNTGLTLCLAFDYGGREEILQAARSIISSGIPPDRIDELALSQHLYTRDIPDPDLIIRTGGEFRLSNFLLWQAAYSELYFTPVLWPDFGAEEIEEALSQYRRRQRRFGNV